MDLKILKDFVKLAKKEGVSNLKFESDDVKLSVSFGTGSTQVVSAMPSMPVPTPAPEPKKVESAPKSSENFHEIRSPFVGTFYRSSAPGEAAYINPGDRVAPGQVLCILEAMKIMNEIESDSSGEIVEICVENESLVEFGQVLFKIRKS